ncbi:hypothetical protein AB0K34_13755 [Actinomadura sp. NPDC049382]|uniref:hypothetical protein n=1 Tax=Actinomadura sp. NPDC049382 TaxID=3158220 RepID=UPI0034309AB8
MTSLHELNREEWADKPYLLELRGGSVDGQRFCSRDLPRFWKVPEPAIVDLTTDLTPSTYPESLRIALYRETGSVTDDGAHIYEFERHE